MRTVTTVYGVALAALGLGGYFATGRVSVTALIPFFLGVAVLVCAALAGREEWRKHAMHAAAFLGLLGVVGPLRVLPQMVRLLSGGEVAHRQAVVAQAVLLALSAVFLALCVKSFIDARRGRTA
jgi:hypothetical protein